MKLSPQCQSFLNVHVKILLQHILKFYYVPYYHAGPQRTLFQLGAGSISRTGSSHEAEEAEEVEAGANYPRNSTQYENAGNSQQSRSISNIVCNDSILIFIRGMFINLKLLKQSCYHGTGRTAV